MERWLRAGSIALAFSAFCALTLPWFKLPVLGWSIPTPAWNRTGLVLLALAACHFTRGLGWGVMRWPVRLAVFPAAYLWWGSEDAFRQWGTGTLAPLQLKLSSFNRLLAKFNLETLDIFEPRLWKQLDTGPGWYLAGATLVATLVLTSLDRVQVSVCPSCSTKNQAKDCHCHVCGHKFKDFKGCSRCGRTPAKGDKYCRDCGQEYGTTIEPEKGE